MTEQHEPQLSAEMEKRFNDFINQGTSYKEIKHFLATALEEQRAAERTRTIEEMLELVNLYFGERRIGDKHLEIKAELVAKLEAMKEVK